MVANHLHGGQTGRFTVLANGTQNSLDDIQIHCKVLVFKPLQFQER